MSSALLLPFALRLSDQKLFAPDEVERGLACNCVCPGCFASVMAKQGVEKQWHFAHVKTATCNEGYGVSIHEFAKQLLRELKVIHIPAIVVYASAIDAFGHRLDEQEPAFAARELLLDSCEINKNYQDIHVDVLGMRANHPILIEITVFHRLMPDKKQRIVDNNLAAVQLNLSLFTKLQPTRDMLISAIHHPANWSWIHYRTDHPKYQQALLNVQNRINQQLAASQAQYDEIETRRVEKIAQNLKLAQQEQHEWNAKIQASFTQNISRLLFKSSLPRIEQIHAAADLLIEQVAVDKNLILSKAASFQNRGQLSRYSEQSFVQEWQNLLNISEAQTIRFLLHAGYLMEKTR